MARIPETASIEHRLNGPNWVTWQGDFCRKKMGLINLKIQVLKIEDENGHVHNLNLVQKWAIKTPRPVTKRLPMTIPLVSGQRIIDTLFPIA